MSITSDAAGIGEPIRPLVLSHHHVGQEERCLVIGRFHVCRRCALLYPIAFAVLFLAAGGVHWPRRWDAVLVLALPAPAAIDYVLEQLGALRFSARRQALVTILAAPALGRAFHRYLSEPDDSSLRMLLLGYGVAGLCAWAYGLRRTAQRRRAAQVASMEWAAVDFADDDAVAAMLAAHTPTEAHATALSAARLAPVDTSAA